MILVEKFRILITNLKLKFHYELKYPSHHLLLPLRNLEHLPLPGEALLRLALHTLPFVLVPLHFGQGVGELMEMGGKG
jgi:hypothetical protein